MTDARPSVVPLILMVLVYMLFVLGAAGYFFTGLMFGSEIYRDRGIPLAEWAMIAGPLVFTIAMLSATIMFWNKGRQRVSYALFAAMLIAVLAVLTLFKAPVL